MSESTSVPAPWEPERYELTSEPVYHFDLDRRVFFKFLGAGVLVVSILKPTAWSQESGRTRAGKGDALPREIDAWLHIGENDRVTVYTGKVEVGQNIRTSLSQAVAEELHLPLEKIDLVMGDTQLTPFDMGTFGSRTTPTMNLQLRKVAAAACDLLIGLAAVQWQTDRQHLVAADGKVLDPKSGRSAEYAALIKGQQLTQHIAAEDPLIPAASWTVMGQSLPKVVGVDFVTGKHRYPSDQKLPDMWYGKILRPPSFGATLLALDSKPAEQMGAVVVRDGNFVGVAAPSFRLAVAAIAALHADWKSEPQPSSKELFDYLKKNTAGGTDSSGDGDRYDTGKVDEALASASLRLQQTYTVSYIAHVPLEPRAALAKWDGDSLTVWTGTQRPFGVRGELAEVFRIPEDRVRVLMPDTGSAYGGKHTGDAAIEAARLARAAGRPVKVVWTREEEFTWAYFRPAGVIEVKSAISPDGKLLAWDFHNYHSGSSGIETPYEVPNVRIAFHSVPLVLRSGSYRGLAATANHFARETHMDALALAANIDPLEFRLKNLEDARLRAVLEAAVKSFGWPRTKAAGRGFGIAAGNEKGSYVATCAEIAVDNSANSVRVVRLVTAFECGAIVNPDGLRNQVIGANIQGLGGALFEAIEFENGRITNPRFSRYRVPRFRDVPEIEAVLLDRKDIAPAGAGETPIMAVAPAIGNAIFDATGQRLNNMPLVPNGLKKT